MMFQAPREGLHNATQMMMVNWHLGRMGASFDQVLIDELGSPGLPSYRLYIMANAFYLSAEERERIRRVFQRDGATVLWVYAPGYLNDTSASLGNMAEVTGMSMGMVDAQAELDVTLTRFDHPLTQGLEEVSYGTGIDREQYLAPPGTFYLPKTSVSPAFYVDDPEALVLGTASNTGRAGLAVKTVNGFISVYSAAPMLSWRLLRNLARWAGAHLYSESGDMIWANRSFLCIYAQSDGECVVPLERTCDVYDAYEDRLLELQTSQVTLDMRKWETRLFILA